MKKILVYTSNKIAFIEFFVPLFEDGFQIEFFDKMDQLLQRAQQIPSEIALFISDLLVHEPGTIMADSWQNTSAKVLLAKFKDHSTLSEKKIVVLSTGTESFLVSKEDLENFQKEEGVFMVNLYPIKTNHLTMVSEAVKKTLS